MYATHFELKYFIPPLISRLRHRLRSFVVKTDIPNMLHNAVPQVILLLQVIVGITDANTEAEAELWEKWWTYQGISGPKYWGVVNERWRLCEEGRRQSPVNIDLNTLLFDPTLPELTIHGSKTDATFVNMGTGVALDLHDSAQGRKVYVISGPLSYSYRIYRILFHFSRLGNGGSEHSVGGVTFPSEIQLLGYNADLYKNSSDAEQSPHGLVSVAIFVQLQKEDYLPFNSITRGMKKVLMRGSRTTVRGLDIRALVPDTKLYVTYEGSQTYPGCHETVTWVILNKPLYLSNAQLTRLRSVNQGGPDNPQMFLRHNRRPRKPLNQRPVRTNIDMYDGCTMRNDHMYEANRRHWH